MGKEKFNGYIDFTEKASISSHEKEKKIPNNPNIVYIILDDVGFAQLQCFGSTIETPNINKLAENGLKYNNFHTTAICSATRASLLTGANHHSAGISTVVDSLDGSYPNKNAYLDPHYATTAEVLKEYGYTNLAVGKWHLTPFDEATDAGPYDNWPLAKGFDRFYGFLEGYTDQYTPDLVKDNERIRPPYSPEEGYHLSEDLVDQAVKLVNRHHTVYPEKPFFLYFALGAGHSPHQVSKEYIDKYKGKFDAGWDEIRKEWFENQKKLGIIPENTKLNPRNKYAKAWDELNDDEKKVYARYMEVYAGFLTHADYQIGRLLNYLDSEGVLENTVVVLLSDNGASAEGGRNGRLNTEKAIDLVNETNNVELSLPHLEELGSDVNSNPHYPVGWANAGNTPFQWYKSWVHSGGVKDPLIISYPKGIKAKGEIRSQYLHVSDIAPTILDILGVKKPDYVKGVAQKDYQGTSFKYTFDDADAPNRKHVQYYEQTGNRGIWKDGWKAVVDHSENGSDLEDYIGEKWELYHTDEDYSESENVADEYPQKLQELVATWYVEAGKNGVLPLTSSGAYITKTSEELAKSFGDNKFYLEPQKFEYKNVVTPIDIPSKTMFNRRNHKITVELNHRKGNEGILYSAGNRFGGYVLYVKDNHVKYTYNYHREQYFNIISEDEIPEGNATVQIQFVLTERNTAIAKLFINGKEQGSTEITGFIHMLETRANIKDGGSSAVVDDIKLPFVYPDRLDKVTLEAASFLADAKELEAYFFSID